MKKIIVMVLGLFLLVGCSSSETVKNFNKDFKINNQVLSTTNNNLGYETLKNVNHNIIEVNVSTLRAINKIDQPYFLMIGRPSCSHCEDVIPFYSKLAMDRGIKNIYYWSFENVYQKTLKNQTLNEQETKDVRYLEKTYKFDGTTPIIYVVKKGKVIDSTNNTKYEGDSWEETLKNFYKNTAK